MGRLWALLRALNLWDNTTIILTADHGEQFFEHAYLGHKHDLYVESLHVPLIIKYAGQTQAARDSRVVNLIDLCPTILGLVGCDAPPPFNGRSLRAAAPGEDHPTFFELQTTWAITHQPTGERRQENDQWVAVRRGRYKLLHVVGTGFWQLYDAVADPQERHPLGAAHEETAVALRGQIERWRAAMQELAKLWQPGPQAQLSYDELERLRSLGYIR